MLHADRKIFRVAEREQSDARVAALDRDVREKLAVRALELRTHGATDVEGERLTRCGIFGELDGEIELHVLDEGAGFPPAFLERAFERFARADEARTEGGAGLGLAIVQVIAEAHGGAAHASGRPDGGADVWLSLPGSARA